jgi:DNA-binding response OmpR family regulator
VSSRQVLVVEPDAALAGRLRAALETCGFSVRWLTDSDDAARALADTTPELVLLDLEPAASDSLCKLVKKKRKQTPILVLADNGEGDRLRRRWFGRTPDVVLPKPVVIEDLLREVRQLFNLAAPPLGEVLVHESDDLVVMEGQEEVTDVRQTPFPKAAAPSSFAKEHEALELRQLLNAKEKQLLDLKDQLDQKERLILQHRHATLEVERKSISLDDTILALEQKLLAANERISALDSEADVMMKALAAKDEELKVECARGQQALAAAAEEAKQQKSRADLEHASNLDRQRKEHEAALAKQAGELTRKHDEVVANLEQKLAKAIDTVRGNAKQVEQAREVLASAAALLAKNIAVVNFDEPAHDKEERRAPTGIRAASATPPAAAPAPTGAPAPDRRR